MLFKNTDELSAFLTFASGLRFEDLSPHIDSSEISEIIPDLSQEQYDLLQTDYDANSTDADHVKLLKRVRHPLAHMAFYKWSIFSDKNLGANGISVIESADLKMASQWRVEDLREYCLSQYDIGMDLLLKFLEANKTIYTQWASSTSYTVYKECFINTADEFSTLFNIAGSRRTFKALNGIMKRCEVMYIKSITGQDQYDDIKSEIAAGSVSANNKKLLEFIKPAVACFTGFRACAEMAIILKDSALAVSSTSSALSQNVKSTPADSLISLRMSQAQQDAQNFQEQLRKYLYANHATYPLYEADSTVYISSGLTNPNSQGSGIYFM